MKNSAKIEMKKKNADRGINSKSMYFSGNKYFDTCIRTKSIY